MLTNSLQTLLNEIKLMRLSESDPVYIHTDTRICTMTKDALFRRLDRMQDRMKLYALAYVLWKENLYPDLLEATLKKIRRMGL